MFAVVLAGACAFVWGAADFCGGKASRVAPPLPVTVVSQVCSVPVILVCLMFVPGEPLVADVLWGAVAGLAGFAGLALLYGALAAGVMAVVAPVTAVTATLVPLLVGLVVDRYPGGLALAGIGCAIASIALVSVGPGGGGGAVSPRVLGRGLLAGAMFGVFFSLLGQATVESGMWPLAAVRASSIGLGVLLVLVARESLRLPGGALRVAALAGVLDAAANALYVAAVVRGHLSVVAAIASLYPASTVLLALVVDRERLRLHQVAGLGLAAVALVLASA